MEIKEIRTKKISELHNLLAVRRAKLRELRFKDANKQLGNVREIREVKKELAQILTILNQQEKQQPSIEAETVKQENK